jgi:hypothetical protein
LKRRLKHIFSKKFLLYDVFHTVYKAFHVGFAKAFLGSRVLHVVTATNSSHFYSLLQLLRTLQVIERTDYRLYVYDLGLTEEELSHFARLHLRVEIIRFPFEDYPRHFDLSLPPDYKGQYAWKPCIIHEVYSKLGKGDFLVWLDAGNFVQRKMWLVRSALHFKGFYTRLNPHNNADWTHKDTMRLLGMEHAGSYTQVCGCLIGLKKNELNDRMMDQWKEAALDPDVIAPVGSSRMNHRQDQAVLSLLYYKLYPYTMNPPLLSRIQHEISIHKDIG